jgi:hypothetical protein
MALRKLPAAGYDLTSSIFVSMLVLCMGLLIYVCSIGFPTSGYQVLVVCGLSLLFSNFSVVFRTLTKTDYRVGFDAALTLALFFTVLLASLLPSAVTSLLVSSLAVAGYLSLIYLLFITEGGPLRRSLIPVVLCPILMAVWILGFVHLNGVHHPLFLENISLGIINGDLLFHTTVAEMLRTYGVATTGLYETPYMSFHYGSHVVFAGLSNLLNTSALEAYSNLFPLFFLPLYFRAILFLTRDLRQTIYPAAATDRTDWVFWVSILVLNINFLPNDFLQNWAILNSWVLSESYVISLILLFLAISIGLALLGNRKNILMACVLSVFMLSALLVMGFSKISTIMVFAGAASYLFFRTGMWKSPVVACSFLVLAVIVVTVYMATARLNISLAAEGGFYPFHFIKTYTTPVWRSLFFLVFYSFLIIYIFLRAGYLGIKGLRELVDAIKTRKALDIEFCVVIAAVGFVPVALLSIAGGSADYFIDVQTRVVLPFILAWVLQNREQTDEAAQNVGRFVRRHALAMGIALLFVANNVFSQFENLVNSNLQLRMLMLNLDKSQSVYAGQYKDVYHYLSGSVDEIGSKIKEILYLPGKIISEQPRWRYYRWLSETSSGIENKQDKLIAIDKGSGFWKDGHERPDFAPFIFTSMTGMAYSNGLPDNYKELVYYGFVVYHDMAIDTAVCRPSGKTILVLSPYEAKLEACQ